MSEVIPPKRKCHTTRPPSTPYQLCTLESNHCPLVVLNLGLTREKIVTSHNRKAGLPELRKRGVVALIPDYDTRTHR